MCTVTRTFPLRCKANRTAARIFDRAGLRTEWSDFPVRAEEIESCEHCRRAVGATDFTVRLVGDSMIPEWAHRGGLLAYSVNPTGNGFPTIATVFAQRVEGLAHREGYPFGVVLGHVIAHELGHLLLRLRGHAGCGIMGFPMNRRRLEKASRGELLFVAGQARSIREQVRKRMAVRRSPPGKATGG